MNRTTNSHHIFTGLSVQDVATILVWDGETRAVVTEVSGDSLDAEIDEAILRAGYSDREVSLIPVDKTKRKLPAHTTARRVGPERRDPSRAGKGISGIRGPRSAQRSPSPESEAANYQLEAERLRMDREDRERGRLDRELATRRESEDRALAERREMLTSTAKLESAFAGRSLEVLQTEHMRQTQTLEAQLDRAHSRVESLEGRLEKEKEESNRIERRSREDIDRIRRESEEHAIERERLMARQYDAQITYLQQRVSECERATLERTTEVQRVTMELIEWKARPSVTAPLTPPSKAQGLAEVIAVLRAANLDPAPVVRAEFGLDDSDNVEPAEKSSFEKFFDFVTPLVQQRMAQQQGNGGSQPLQLPAQASAQQPAQPTITLVGEGHASTRTEDSGLRNARGPVTVPSGGIASQPSTMI